MLEVEQLSSFYGPIQALREVSLQVDAGEVVAVLGPNGAGKSTLLRTISGLVRPRHGSIRYEGREIAGKSPDAIVRLGIVHVPEGRRIFTQMTVLENLMMGAFTRNGRREVRDDLEFVFSLFPDLAEKKGQLGGQLSGGQQQMLAISRAIMARPSLLLLDEPSLGLAPILLGRLGRLGRALAAIREKLEMSIVLVEQNAALALEMASRVYVMKTGQVAFSGPTVEVSVEDIRSVYLGGASAPAHPGGLPPNQVQRRVEEDPDNINEVPVLDGRLDIPIAMGRPVPAPSENAIIVTE